MNSEGLRRLKIVCDARDLRVAAAESVTVGHIQSILGAVSGSSTFFSGGMTAYNLDQKVMNLGVERSHAESVDCVSPQVASEMAAAATRVFDAHIGLATTGYAELPDGSPQEEPYAYFAIFDRHAIGDEAIRAGRITCKGMDRVRTQRYFAEYVMNELLAYLKVDATSATQGDKSVL